MPKSKCEQSLEAMTAERDHWRNLAQQRAGEIADLQRQLERSASLARVMGSGIDAELERYQLERDQARAAYEYVTDALIKAVGRARNTAEYWIQEVTRIQAELDTVVENHGVPYLVGALNEAGCTVLGIAADEYNKFVGGAIVERGGEYNAKNDPVLALNDLIMLSQNIAAGMLTTSITWLAYANSFDARIVCAEIIKQCHSQLAPDENLIMRLSPQWIQENLDDAPKAPGTLRDGLAYAHKAKLHIAAGGKLKDFVDTVDKGERVIRRYLGWYDAIEATGEQAPPLVEITAPE